ncbi:MAG: hypothetical protein ACP5N9_00520 [Candidatus Bilamarchaeum sp.]|jgi:hypothetical protein
MTDKKHEHPVEKKIDQEIAKVPSADEQKAASEFIQKIVENAFEDMWKTQKEQFKNLSKQEMARVMFFEGARFMMIIMDRANQQMNQAPVEEQKK